MRRLDTVHFIDDSESISETKHPEYPSSQGMKRSESMRHIKPWSSLISGKVPYKNPFIIESTITGKKGVNIKTSDEEIARDKFKRQNNIGSKSYQSL